jgi:hypothetical protein
LSVRYVVIERRGGSDITLTPDAGAKFRAEWEFRLDFNDNRPIEVADVDGVHRSVRPRDVADVKNLY